MGDRSGSREPKGASLKKSKKNPGASAAKAKKASLKSLGILSGPVSSLPPPPLAHDIDGGVFDCGVALLSRQFDRDRDRVVQRALGEGKCLGLLTWFSDIEKQSHVADFCKANSGFCYFATGIHPDNIDRTNKKSHDDWVKQIEELGRKAECIAILSGLNLSREMGTHFSQESLLKSSIAVAEKLILPTIFHVPETKSLERVLEILGSDYLGELDDIQETVSSEEGVFIIHDFITCSAADESVLANEVLQHPQIYYSISGAGITDPDETLSAKAKQFVSRLSRDRLLLCSDSPWHTPQNLSDPYLRTLRNEPANIPAVVQAIAEALALSVEETSRILLENATRVFGLEKQSELNILAASAAAVAAAPQKAAASSSAAPSLEAAVEKLSVSGCEQSSPTFSSAPTTSNSNIEAVYRCVKCRLLLFQSKDVTTHQLSAVKTVFKVGEEGLCSSFHFVPAAEGRDIHKRLGLTIRGGNVECSSCGVKLGKYSPGEAVCPCGAVVHGPVTKINANKVDYHADGENAAVEQLAERSRVEIENAALQAIVDEEEEESRLAMASGRVRKSKKHKSENKGNFSSFRNKSFVPNASKTAPPKKGDSQKGKGQRQAESDEEKEASGGDESSDVDDEDDPDEN